MNENKIDYESVKIYCRIVDLLDAITQEVLSLAATIWWTN
jgi:hypothetical protein